MKTLSLRGLWGYLIAAGIKDVENRRTLKNIRGWHLIHVSKNYDFGFDVEYALNKNNSEEYELLHSKRINKLCPPTSCIIGAMYIGDCKQGYKSKWAEEGVNNLVLDTSKSILFDKPIENVKGKLSVWEYELPQEYYEKYPQLTR